MLFYGNILVSRGIQGYPLITSFVPCNQPGHTTTRGMIIMFTYNYPALVVQGVRHANFQPALPSLKPLASFFLAPQISQASPSPRPAWGAGRSTEREWGALMQACNPVRGFKLSYLRGPSWGGGGLKTVGYSRYMAFAGIQGLKNIRVSEEKSGFTSKHALCGGSG